MHIKFDAYIASAWPDMSPNPVVCPEHKESRLSTDALRQIANKFLSVSRWLHVCHMISYLE